MTPNAIAKLRRTFIAIAMASFFVVIAFMGSSVSVANIIVITSDANRTIDAILNAHGDLPSKENYADDTFFEEATFGLRYFTVTYDRNGQVIAVDLSHVASVNRSDALELAKVAEDPKTLTHIGRHGTFIYKEGPVEEGSMVVSWIALSRLRMLGKRSGTRCSFASWPLRSRSWSCFSFRSSPFAPRWKTHVASSSS